MSQCKAIGYAVSSESSHSVNRKEESMTTTATKPSKRIEWIDIAKGLGIILVSFGHLRNGDGQSVWLPAMDGPITAIYLFHMPLFYLLGGLTFSTTGGFKSFVIRKVRTLLIPYYVFSLYFLAKPFAVLLIPSMGAAFQSDHAYSVADQFWDVLIMGNGLWFLMAFFVAEILMYGIVSFLRSTRHFLSEIALVGVVLIVFSYMRGYVFDLPKLPFQLWTGVSIVGFICVGYALRGWLKSVDRKKSALLTGVSAVIFVSLSIVVLNVSLGLSIQWIFRMFAAATGAFACIFACITLSHSAILSYIGRFSLVFYALNAFTLNIVKIIVFRALHLDLTSCVFIIQGVGGLAVTILALGLLWVENLFVQRYMPWAIGISKPARHSKQRFQQ
jgi:fucose 4-O-acetylase-like acetyltransferase